MTLTICIKAKDGIVLASDSRASAFLTSNDTVKKIFGLDDHNAVGISGDGSLAIHLFDTFAGELDFSRGILQLAEQIRTLGKERFEKFFSHQVPKDRPDLTILLIGYNSENSPDIYRLSSKDNFVPRKSPTGFDCIGIPIIANYLLNRLYEPEITVANAAKLATFCIKETSSQDSKVGGPTQIAMFSDSDSYKELSLEEVEKLEKDCEKLRLLQKANFYPEEDAEGPETSEEAVKE